VPEVAECDLWFGAEGEVEVQVGQIVTEVPLCVRCEERDVRCEEGEVEDERRVVGEWRGAGRGCVTVILLFVM